VILITLGGLQGHALVVESRGPRPATTTPARGRAKRPSLHRTADPAN